ncbi:MAG: polysaccharide deacetylase family protein [Candidatus Marinimicrobia bacterium]|nr:polysaccharide deacetylase family protein [Candidatus Neomarinimicrobiota bacterium]
MYNRCLAIIMLYLSVFVCWIQAQTHVQVQVINLPIEFEGDQLALAGTINNWNNNLSLSVVADNTLSLTFYDIDITPLDYGWLDIPDGANAAFSFFQPGTWNQVIVGNYGSNDNNFRVALTSDIMNIVVIDAQYSLTAPPWLIIDINEPSLIVNGEVQLPPPAITNLSVSVINLPNEYEGQNIAIHGPFIQEENNIFEATVFNNSLTYSFENLELAELGPEWINSPLDANITFAFLDPQSLSQLIIGDYNGNNNYFRVRLAADMDNSVVIDADYITESLPLTIDILQGIFVNGNVHLPNRNIDPTLYAWPDGKWKALIMSYDDGPSADVQMVDLFNSNGIIGTFSLTSSFLGNDDFVSSGQVSSLYENHEVANHSEHHPYLAHGDTTAIRNEIENCSNTLSNLVGYDINGMAYPFGGAGTGAYDYRVIDIAQNEGIRYARTTNDTRSLEIPQNLPDGLMQWDPTINDWDGITFANQLIDWDLESMALLYMWGHSHFLDNGGWNRLTTICQDLGNRDDIWYARNIEVANYLRAINNLVYTDSTVYNQSSDISIWLKIEDGLEIIVPGQTLFTDMLDIHEAYTLDGYVLNQNYPNPFNPESVISYELSTYGNTSLTIHNLLGQEIKILVNQRQWPGSYSVKFDGSEFTSGVYIYRLQADNFSQSKKMLLIK